MDTKALAEFNPTEAHLLEMVKATKKITVDDMGDPKQLAVVKENRIELKKARVQIEKTGKALREDANAFAKAVIAKEKELIAIIAPEEDRLEALEDEAKRIEIRMSRIENLPFRRERIVHAGVRDDATDDQLLDMDGTQFETYFNGLVAEKNERDAAKMREEQEARDRELREREAKVREEERRIQHEKEVKEAAERAAKETEARIAREREENQRREKELAERAEREKKEAQAKLEKQKKYQEFLASHGYTKEGDEFRLVETPEGVALYKKLGVFNK